MFPRCSRLVSTLLATALLAASLGCGNRGGDNTVVGLPFGGGSSGSGGGAGGGGGGGAAGFAVAATNPDSGPTNGFPTLAAINNVDPANAIISVTFGEAPTVGAADPTAIDFTVNNTPRNFQVIQTTNSQLLSVPVGAGNTLTLQGVVNFDPNNNTATFAPDAVNPLQLNTQYTVVIRGVVADLANGNALSQFDYVFYFQTDAVNNFVPGVPPGGGITVIQTDPATATNNGNPFAAGFRHDPTDRTITATFSQVLNAATVNVASVLVEVGNPAQAVPGAGLNGGLQVNGAVVTFTAAADFPANTLVTVSLNNGIQNGNGDTLHPYIFRVITRSNVGTGDFLINEVFAHCANNAGVAFAQSDANNNGLDEPHIDQFVEYVNVSGGTLDVTELACLSAENIVKFIGPAATILRDGETGNNLPTHEVDPNRVLLFLNQDADAGISAASPVVFDFGAGTVVVLIDTVISSPTLAPVPPGATPFLGNEFTDLANRSGAIILFDPIGDPLATNAIDQFVYPNALAPNVQLPLAGFADSMQRQQDALNGNAAQVLNYLPHSGFGGGLRFSPGKTFGGLNFP